GYRRIGVAVEVDDRRHGRHDMLERGDLADVRAEAADQRGVGQIGRRGDEDQGGRLVQRIFCWVGAGGGLDNGGPEREVAAGGTATDDDLGGIDAELGGVFLNPADGGAAVSHRLDGSGVEALFGAVVGGDA